MKQYIKISICLFLALLCPVANAQLLARTDVSLGQNVWSYTIFNEEGGSSSNFIASFYLSVAAPITVIGTPTGWDFDSDGQSYVFWFNIDNDVPYPNQVSPGASLSGFQLISTANASILGDFNLAAWDHALDIPGSTLNSQTLVPFVPTIVPEPGVCIVATGLICAILFFGRGHTRKVTSHQKCTTLIPVCFDR